MRYSMMLLVVLVSCGPATQKKRIKRTFETANTRLEQGYFDDAIALYSQVIDKDPEIVDAFMNRGVAYFESGRFALALADYNHVYFNYPEYPEVLFNRVYCHLELERFELAKESLGELKKLFPDSALVDLVEGLSWERQGNDLIAKESFLRAIKKDSSNFDAWSNVGIICYRQKDYDNAQLYLRKALFINQSAPVVLNPLALVCADMGNLSEADSLITVALNLVPDDPYFMNNKGYIELKKGNYELADEWFTKSLNQDSLNPWVYYNKGLWNVAVGELVEAREMFERSINIDSTMNESILKLNEINSYPRLSN